MKTILLLVCTFFLMNAAQANWDVYLEQLDEVRELAELELAYNSLERSRTVGDLVTMRKFIRNLEKDISGDSFDLPYSRAVFDLNQFLVNTKNATRWEQFITPLDSRQKFFMIHQNFWKIALERLLVHRVWAEDQRRKNSNFELMFNFLPIDDLLKIPSFSSLSSIQFVNLQGLFLQLKEYERRYTLAYYRYHAFIQALSRWFKDQNTSGSYQRWIQITKLKQQIDRRREENLREDMLHLILKYTLLAEKLTRLLVTEVEAFPVTLDGKEITVPYSQLQKQVSDSIRHRRLTRFLIDPKETYEYALKATDGLEYAGVVQNLKLNYNFFLKFCASLSRYAKRDIGFLKGITHFVEENPGLFFGIPEKKQPEVLLPAVTENEVSQWVEKTGNSDEGSPDHSADSELEEEQKIEEPAKVKEKTRGVPDLRRARKAVFVRENPEKKEKEQPSVQVALGTSLYSIFEKFFEPKATITLHEARTLIKALGGTFDEVGGKGSHAKVKFQKAVLFYGRVCGTVDDEGEEMVSSPDSERIPLVTLARHHELKKYQVLQLRDAMERAGFTPKTVLLKKDQN